MVIRQVIISFNYRLKKGDNALSPSKRHELILCYYFPRVVRIIVPSVPHHVTQRGNNRQCLNHDFVSGSPHWSSSLKATSSIARDAALTGEWRINGICFRDASSTSLSDGIMPMQFKPLPRNRPVTPLSDAATRRPSSRVAKRDRKSVV